MNKPLGRRGAHPAREDIRILPTNTSTPDGVAFQGIADNGKTHHFLMTSGVLQELGGQADARLDPASAFERHRQQIHGVATRVFGAGVRGEPIVMRIGFFKDTQA